MNSSEKFSYQYEIFKRPHQDKFLLLRAFIYLHNLIDYLPKNFNLMNTDQLKDLKVRILALRGFL